MNIKKQVVGLTFPSLHNSTLAAEPSILYVLPEGDNVEYHYSIHNLPNGSLVQYYACSVYLTGLNDFFKFLKTVDPNKVIVGGPQPSMTPEIFNECYKVVKGICSDFYATINQPGKFINGIIDWNHLPRYDLYNYKANNRVPIPLLKNDENFISIFTSVGCINNCPFCCTPAIFNNTIYLKPLEQLNKEIEYIKKSYNQEFFSAVLIRDENFLALGDWENRIDLMNKQKITKNFYCTASPDQIKGKAHLLAVKNIKTVSCDLGVIGENYKKSHNIKEVIKELKDNNIIARLTFVIDPTKIVLNHKTFFKNLKQLIDNIGPDLVQGHYLTPYPGTPLSKKYDIKIENCYSTDLTNKNNNSRTPEFLLGYTEEAKQIKNQMDLIIKYQISKYVAKRANLDIYTNILIKLNNKANL